MIVIAAVDRGIPGVISLGNQRRVVSKGMETGSFLTFISPTFYIIFPRMSLQSNLTFQYKVISNAKS